MERAELIVFPIAMLVLCYVIGNIPFMVFPAIAIPCVILTSFSLVYGITKKMDVVSFAPSLMMSISMVSLSSIYECMKRKHLFLL